MGAYKIEIGGLAPFRAEWVSGHLDRLRAVDALESARSAAERAAGEDAVRCAEATIADALKRLADVEAMLVSQFNCFCGIR